MTAQNNAALAADADPLTDEYVNAVIQRHGYDSPESVIAQLHQRLGLHGGEDSVTLLMYEAHKALPKLRARVGEKAFMYGVMGPDGKAYLDEFCVSADPAELEQEVVAPMNANHTDGKYSVVALFAKAAPQPSEAVRIVFPAYLRKMWSGGEVQAWLDEHQGVIPPKASAKGNMERYRAWQAHQGEAKKDCDSCSCPSGDGSLRHPRTVHPQADRDKAALGIPECGGPPGGPTHHHPLCRVATGDGEEY